MELNPQQQKAASWAGGHLLVLAGAGSGKTRTLISRALHLIRSGADPGRIALLAFTRRAASEMGARLESQAGSSARAMFAGTFHSFCLHWMRSKSGLFASEGTLVIDRDDAERLMGLCRAGFVVEKKKGFPKAQEIANVHSYTRNTGLELEAYIDKFKPELAEFSERIGRIVKAYEERKKDRGYLDFDDILFSFAKTLEESAEARDAVRSSYDHLLVDEMQDTNPLQWKILDALKDPPRLFLVGDDAQSIYAFRGADFRNVHSFRERVAGGEVLALEDNYRSFQEILDLANWLLSRSGLDYNKHLGAARGFSGKKPSLMDFDDPYSEADWLGSDLMKRHEAGEAWRGHMVLVRTAYSARPIEAALVERGIPYVFIGGFSFLQSAHVKDLLAAIRCAMSLKDEISWMRYLCIFPGIGEVTAKRMMDAMAGSGSAGEAALSLRKAFPKQAGEIIKGPAEASKHWKDPAKAVAGLSGMLSPIQERRYEKWEMRSRDYELLADLAARHQDLREFVETYTLDPIAETRARRAAEEDAVTLITVHSAKGTEAKVCYITQARPGMYPHSRSIGDADAEEEERRILYVAITRAADELVLTRSRPAFNQFASYEGAEESYLLSGLPKSLVHIERSHAFGRAPPFQAREPWDQEGWG